MRITPNKKIAITMNQQELSNLRLQKAQKRVKEIKGFYQHLTVYLLVNLGLLLFSQRIQFILLSEEALGNPKFLEWINWNVLGTPIIWGVALLIHAVSVFAKSPFRKWEERQIRKIMEEDNEFLNR
ncbi:MAG: 2TM domain-containing protein [Bacteroidota bacterium]